MKQLLFMIACTLLGTVGAVWVNPFYGVAVYYLYAVLRPPFLWQWVLPRGIAWSFYVAVATIVSVVGIKVGLFRGPPVPEGEIPFRFRMSAAHRTAMVFFAWICVTYFTSRNREYSYPFFVEYLKIFVMFVISSYAIHSLKQIWALYLVAALSLGYIGYEVNDIYFFQGRFMYIYEMGYGGLDNNGAGLMMAMGVPLCYFAWEGITRWWRWAFLALIPCLLHAVLMSFSRGAMVAVIAVTPFFLLRSRRRMELALFLVGVSFLVPALAGKEIRARFFSIQQNEVDASANSRRMSWNAAWTMATENPIFGVGIRNADLLSYSYGADVPGRTIHSQFLQTAADSGLVGLGLYLIALLMGWLSSRRARQMAAARDDPEARHVHAIASGVEGGMAVFCVGGLFLSLENFELPYLLLLLAVQLPVVYQGHLERQWLTASAEPGPLPTAC
jgi:probable O-glycosylation ligase (exosortase A-associated)